ncbi:hypothetical protein CsSME_00025396 [Camellia sinensis var. sinensis]
MVSCTSSGADTTVREEGVFHAPLVSGSFKCDTAWVHVPLDSAFPPIRVYCSVYKWVIFCPLFCSKLIAVLLGFVVVFDWFMNGSRGVQHG